jgi:hypothetical protein
MATSRDLPFSRNQPLKTADDYYNAIFKKIIKSWDVPDNLKNRNKIRPCDLTM